MNASVNRAGPQAIVYTKQGQALRVPLPAGVGYSPEQQLARWLTYQARANPGFPARVKSLLLLVRQPPCAECRQALYQALHRWNLAGRLRTVVSGPTDNASAACRCSAEPQFPAYDAGAADQEPLLLAELEKSASAPETVIWPLEGAGKKLRAQGWKRGIYVIQRNKTPIYVGKASTLGERVQQHALSLTHLLIPLDNYAVQVYHYPTANDATLLARERELYNKLKAANYKLGNKLNTELEMALELNELALEYEGLFDKFRRLFHQNPVKAAILKGALDAANPLPAKDAALADHVQGITESYIESARQPPATAPGRLAAGAAPPPASRLAQPARPNWAAPTSAYGSRLPSPRVKAPGPRLPVR